jgi:phenylacetate-CoA ligase
LPLTIVVDRARVDFEEALWLRAFFENGLRIRDKMAVVTDPRNFPERKGFFHRLGFLRTEYFSVFDEPARLATALRVCKPDVLKGFPSSLALLAEEFGKKDDFRSRLVFTCAELLDQASRDRISLISGRGLLDYYSCSEFNLLGWECRAHEGYHINVDSTVVEFVRAGEAVTSGERGEIVCTNLSNLSMPLIRYKTGDVGIPSEEQCSCGITLPLMKLIEGRTGDFLTATDSRKISPIIFFPYPFDNEDSYKEINQFRVIQKKRDEITIQLVVGERVLSDEQLENASKKIQKVFGIDMRVNFEFVKKMPIDPSGKLKKIVSWVSTKQ